MTVWLGDIWQEGVWADGVWEGMTSGTSTGTSTSTSTSTSTGTSTSTSTTTHTATTTHTTAGRPTPVTGNIRYINWGAEVRKAWGDEYYEREDVYEFTNDRKVKGR